jgi:hypothetical protein
MLKSPFVVATGGLKMRHQSGSPYLSPNMGGKYRCSLLPSPSPSTCLAGTQELGVTQLRVLQPSGSQPFTLLDG